MPTAIPVAVKERPIVFIGPMVRAIMEGRKTQTRRVLKPQPSHGYRLTEIPCSRVGGVWAWDRDLSVDPEVKATCPYGVPGDRLWVKETWIPVRHGSYEPLDRHEKPRSIYEATTCYAADPVNGYGKCWDSYRGKWRPSIHMPRWASRLTLEIVKVRVERLDAISEEDGRAEGYEGRDSFLAGEWAKSQTDNPWVWVVEFKTTSPQEITR